MSAVSLEGFGGRLLAELRARRSLNDTLFRHLCRSLLPAAMQARRNAADPIVDLADDRDAADGRLLELYTAVLLRCQGHAVLSAGGAKNDGGADVMVRSAAAGSGSAVTSPGGAVMVQCKQYRDTPVNVDVLVQLLGAMDIRTVQHGLLVASSEVTDGVRRLERHLDRRYEHWERKGGCGSCGSGRPLRAQVWDRNKLIALLDQHAAAFVKLREQIVQQLLGDQQLMRLIRLKRGADYCVRHAIHDPLTFPHNECPLGCRPRTEQVEAASLAARGPHPAAHRVRPLYKTSGYSTRDSIRRSEKQPTAPSSPHQTASTQSQSASTPALLTFSTPDAPAIISSPCKLPDPSAFDLSGSLEHLTLTAGLASLESLHSPRLPRSHSTCESPPSSSDVGRAGGAPTSICAQSTTEASEQGPEADEDAGAALLGHDADSDEDSDGALLVDGMHEREVDEDDQYDTPDEIDEDIDADIASLVLASSHETAMHPAPSLILPALGASLATTPISSATQRDPANGKRTSDQHRSPLKNLNTPIPRTPSRQPYSDSPCSPPPSCPTSSLSLCGAAWAVCDGENGELVMAGRWQESDEAVLESLSDDEAAVHEFSSATGADSSSRHCDLPASSAFIDRAQSPVRSVCTVPPRPARTPRRSRHVGIVPVRAVMTGVEERRIAARIDDERRLETEEIDSMLQLILTRPAPHHLIQRPPTTTTPARISQPQPQPQPRNEDADKAMAVTATADEEEEDDKELEDEAAAAAATTASEEQEEIEEMDRLSSDEEDAEVSCRALATQSMIVPAAILQPQPTVPHTPLQPFTNHFPSPPRTPIRSPAILMRPKRIPHPTHPPATRPSADDKVAYTDREVRELILLYRKHGGRARRFVSILDDAGCRWLHVDKVGGRDNVGLKDKWRNLTALGRTKCDVLTAMCNRIEREARLERLANGVREGKQAMKR